MLIFPSMCYETFPLRVAEAFSASLPIVASALGSLASVVDTCCTGLLFRRGDLKDLVAKVKWALAHPAELAGMRSKTRVEFEVNYTVERNYRVLKEIYEAAAS